MFNTQYCIPYTCIPLANGTYVDTGLVPSSDKRLEILFSGNPNGYVFGARNTNSNTSAGQLNYFANPSGNNYFGYHNTRNANVVTDTGVNSSGYIRFAEDRNSLQVTKGSLVLNFTGVTTEFEGTRNIYLGALNNAGTPMYRTSGDLFFYGMALTDAIDYIPVSRIYDIDGETIVNRCGMLGYTDESGSGEFFDLVNVADGILNNFYAVEIAAVIDGTYEAGGGGAYIRLCNGLKTNYCYAYGVSGLPDLAYANCYAEANEGYVFDRWIDGGGNTLSYSNPFVYMPTTHDVVMAVFKPKTQIGGGGGFKTMCIAKGSSSTRNYQLDVYADVLSASINVDVMSKATSTITLKEVPSTYTLLRPIFLYDPRGKCVYKGIIWSIDDNVLTCREPLSIFDEDFLFHANNSIAIIDNTAYNLQQRTLEFALYCYLDSGKRLTDNYAIGDMFTGLTSKTFYQFVTQQTSANRIGLPNPIYPVIPLTEVGVSNLEDFIFDTFAQSGVYVETDLYDDGASHYMRFTPVNMWDYDVLTISDANREDITDISVEKQDDNYTILVVLNSTGTIVRGVYEAYESGYIAQTTLDALFNKYYRYNNDSYKVKVIATDDSMYSQVDQYLARGIFNDSIQFTLTNTNGVNFDEIKMLQPLHFYYGSSLYKSIATGMSFEVNANAEDVYEVRYTFGAVRNRLTDKINLGKFKGKL